MFSLMHGCFQQRVVQIANTTQQSQIPSTEDQAEKEEMKSVMRQLSANVTVVNDTLSKKLQWLVEDESKNKVSLCLHFGVGCLSKFGAWPLYSFCVSIWGLFETWSLFTF
jgi:hypothetical protein